MINTAREVLDFIDEQLLRLPEEETRALWAVLTGLRGPDMIDGKVKQAFPLDRSSSLMRVKQAWTAIIRHAAFPKSGAIACKIPAMHDDDIPACAEIRKAIRTPKLHKSTALCRDNKHFLVHAEQAFKALGLKVFETNKSVSEAQEERSA